MKKKSLISLTLVLLASILALVGCENKENSQSSNNNFQIGINQFTEHPALDQVRAGFEAELEELGGFDIDFMSAQGDMNNTISISEKFVKDKKDLIFAIATPSAQSTKQVTKDLPIVFSAVTDPVETGLVKDFSNPQINITGTSDESPVAKQLELFKKLDKNIKTIGIIYNTSEVNSTIQIENASKAAKDLGLKIESIGVNNINDIPQAVDALLKKVDGIYTLTDNMVASAINVVADKANEKGIITIGAEEAHVKGGILMTDGLSYFELGRQSARMAKEILVDKKDISSFPCEKAETTSKVFNEASLKKLKLDINNQAFKDAEKVK